jgi:glycosyltransferase involved in cell wall biosynthesis
MRILLLSPQYPPLLGGAELQAQRMARELTAMGIRVTVLTQPCAGAAPEDQDGGIRILRRLRTVPLGPLWGMSMMASTARAQRELASEWDLVHNQQVGLHAWASVRSAVRLQKPCVLRFACSGTGGDLASLSGRRFGSTFVRGLRGATRLVALTASGAAEIVRYGLPAQRTTTIPNGIDVRAFAQQPWPDVAAADPLRLLFVGRLEHQKGLDLLLAALAQVEHAVNCRLRVVGTGSLLQQLQTQVRDLGLSERVEFRGVRTDMLAEYAWSEAVVVPSRFEGMPNVVLEAMACGRPVLATHIDGTAELLGDERGGWLVPPDDVHSLAQAIVRLAQLRVSLPQVGEQGRSIVSTHYSLQRIAGLYADEYARALSERPLA